MLQNSPGFHLVQPPHIIAAGINACDRGFALSHIVTASRSRRYLAEGSTYADAHALAEGLVSGLPWSVFGPQKRIALKTIDEIAQALHSEHFRYSFRVLKQLQPFLEIRNGKRGFKFGCPVSEVEKLDVFYAELLNSIAKYFFEKCSHVKQPLKVLRHVLGWTTGLDAETKAGYKRGKLESFSTYIDLLPNMRRLDAAINRKMFALPFELADLIQREKDVLDAAIRQSKYRELEGEYGRVIELLLQMQGDANHPHCYIEFIHRNADVKWYDI